jgi:hypothetical protein
MALSRFFGPRPHGTGPVQRLTAPGRPMPGRRGGRASTRTPRSDHTRGGTPAREGPHDGHQRSNGMAPSKVRATGAHQRWPERVRGGSAAGVVAFRGGDSGAAADSEVWEVL